ncbi:unnamed protein product, partial [Didymodactylos carnosus]
MALTPFSLNDLKNSMIEQIKGNLEMQNTVTNVITTNNNDWNIIAPKVAEVLLAPVIEHLNSRLTVVESKMNDLERYHRTWSLRFLGFQEERNEIIPNKITAFLNKNLNINLC